MSYNIIKYKILRKMPFSKNSFVSILDGKLKGWKWSLHSSEFKCLIGTYEPETQGVFEKYIKANDIVYDIGANVGYFSLLASFLTGKKGRVYSFEPIKDNMDTLTKHVTLNNINNIKGYNYAIADCNKIIKFTNSENKSANTYICNSPMFDISPTIDIQARSLDSLFLEDKLMPPDFIKIDIEGAEFDALKGAQYIIKKYYPVIYVSTHENHLKGVEYACKLFLMNLNYELTLINVNQDTPGIKDYIAVHQKSE